MDVARRPGSPDASIPLSRVLKALRRRRGLRSAEAARHMAMSLRSYQRFESGAMGLDLPKVQRFADMVDADAWAIVFAVEMQAPDFAIACADNKAASALMMALRRFHAQAGKDIARLDTRTVLLVFARAFDDLRARAHEYDAYLEQWMLDESLTETPKDER